MKARTAFAAAVCAFWASPSGTAQTATAKIGIINIQDAIIRTEEGQRTAKALQEKYAPRQTALEKLRRELEDLQASLSKGRNTLSEEARNSLIRQIDAKNKQLTRENEDASAEFQQEESKLISGIGQKMMGVVEKYAKQNGYAIILDISSPQSPVLYAISSVEITSDIVGLYDKGLGIGGAPAAAPAQPSAGTGAPAVTRPPTISPPVSRPPVVPKTPPKPAPGATPKPN